LSKTSQGGAIGKRCSPAVALHRDHCDLCASGGEISLVSRDGDLYPTADGDDRVVLPVVTGILPALVATDRAGVIRRNTRRGDVA